MKIADTVKAFKEIIEGKHDDVPEQAFYMVGTIDEVLEKAEKLESGNCVTAVGFRLSDLETSREGEAVADSRKLIALWPRHSQLK